MRRRQADELLRYLRDPESGVWLGQDEYTRDFEARSWLSDGADSWKLERMQFYDETGFPSWDAFVAGDVVSDLARGLFASGENLEEYFAREIAPLPPPRWAPE